MFKKITSSAMFAVLFLIPAEISAISSILPAEKVIITFDQTINHELLESLNIEVINEYKYIPSVSAEISSFTRSQLLKDHTIANIEDDTPITLKAEVTDYGVSKVETPNAWSYGFKGKGIKIGIIDSGVDLKHSDLKIAGGISFVKEDDGYGGYNDYNGHGTHVTGIIGGLHNNMGIKGIAPDSQIYVIKAFDKTGNSNVTDIIAGLEWSIDNGMDIVNMSLGFQEHVPAFESIVKAAEKRGLLLVGAAGNDGTANIANDTVDYPARYTSVIAVSATNSTNQRATFNSRETNGKSITTYSATGSTVDIAAPGHNITSTYVGNGYSSMSGTSMAAPHVSGILALLMNANPDKKPQEIRELIMNNALDLGVKGKDIVYGNGLVRFKTNKPDIIAPLSPSALEYKSSNSTIILAWAKNKESDVKGYNVYLNNIKVNSSILASNSYKFTNLINGTSYRLQVTAIDQSDNESVKSVPLTATPDSNAPLTFKDVAITHWAYDTIRHASNMGWMNGKNSITTFMPSNSLTRAEAAVIFVRAMELSAPESVNRSFNDVPKTHWAYKEIEIAKKHGLFSGVGTTLFAPNSKITRQEMAVVLNRTIDNPPSVKKAAPFSDLTTSHWAYSSIITMNKATVFGGYSDNTFRPLNAVTRAEMASLVKRIHPLLESK